MKKVNLTGSTVGDALEFLELIASKLHEEASTREEPELESLVRKLSKADGSAVLSTMQVSDVHNIVHRHVDQAHTEEWSRLVTRIRKRRERRSKSSSGTAQSRIMLKESTKERLDKIKAKKNRKGRTKYPYMVSSPFARHQISISVTGCCHISGLFLKQRLCFWP